MEASEASDSSSIPDGATIKLLNSLIASILGELRSKVDTEVDTNIFLEQTEPIFSYVQIPIRLTTNLGKTISTLIRIC